MSLYNFWKEQLLPRWMAGGMHLDGRVHEYFGAPVDQPTRVMVQARAVYTLAKARDEGVPGAEKMMKDCFDRLWIESTFNEADHYERAFLILAVVTMFRFRRHELTYYYRQLHLGMDVYCNAAKEQNPLMHLVEAYLAVLETDAGLVDPSYVRLLISHVLEIFVGIDGVIYEKTDQWLIEPGHQFEWVCLFSKAQQILKMNIFDREIMAVYLHGLRGTRFLERDPVVANGLDANLRLWPQLEAYKAHIVMGRRLPEQRSLASLQRWWLGDGGSWNERLSPVGERLQSQEPASSLYHFTTAALVEKYRCA